MTDVLTPRVTRIRMEIDRLRRFFPEINDDLELLAATIEGETDFDKVADLIIDAFLDRVSLREAVELRIDDMKARAERFGKGADAMKSLLTELMRAADKTMIRRPLATLVMSKGRETLVLDDNFNAQGYMRVKSEPMRTDILAALKAGDDIPGARLETPPPHLSVRTK